MEFKNLKPETVIKMATANYNCIKYPDQPRAFINAKIDWFSVIFQQTTVDSVLKIFQIDKFSDYDKWIEAFNARYVNNFSVVNETYINFEGLNLQLSNYDIQRNYDVEGLSPSDLDQIIFKKVQVNISGEGLDVLRSRGIDVDQLLQDIYDDPTFGHLTRVDFAFDFINIAPTLVDEMASCCRKSETEFHRIRTGKVNGLKYSVRRGDQKTIYLGSPKGSKLVRVYDKKLEYFMSGKGECPYTVQGAQPNSWIRVELQTRRELSEKLLYHQGKDFTYKYVMSLFHDECLPMERYVNPSGGYKLRSFESLEKVVDWHTLPSIIQNIKIEEVYIDPVVKAAKSYENNIVSNLVFLNAFGTEAYLNEMFRQMQYIQSCDSAREQRRGHKFRNSLFSSKLLEENNIKHYCFDGLKIRPVLPDVLDIYTEGKKYFEKGYLERKGIILNDVDD